MQNTIALFCTLIVVLTVVDPAKGEVPAIPSASGKVLVLDNGDLLEGDEIEQVGERFRIRRGAGDTWLPARTGYTLVADRDAAFRMMQQKTKLDDVQARLRLARWCYRNGLHEQAVAETEAACRLRPADRALRQQLDDLKTIVGTPKQVAAPLTTTENGTPETSGPDLRPEQLSGFVNKVQPILMNACVNCHSLDSERKFKLVRTTPGTAPNPKTTQANIAAVAAHVNRDKIGASMLLQKAGDAHGGAAQPPLRDRQSAAYRHLEDWVNAVFGQPSTNVVAASKPIRESERPSKPGTEPFAGATQPIETPPADPFDPAWFNRAVHPPQTRDQKSEVSDQKSEVRDQKNR